MQRENAVDNFRAGKTWVLIATDVVSRGMDFKGVNCVINYDFPDAAAAYIHRIGKDPIYVSLLPLYIVINKFMTSAKHFAWAHWYVDHQSS